MHELIVLKDNDFRICIVHADFGLPRYLVLACIISIKRAWFMPRLGMIAYCLIDDKKCVLSRGCIPTDKAVEVHLVSIGRDSDAQKGNSDTQKWRKKLEKHNISLHRLENACAKIISEALRDDNINKDISNMVQKKYREEQLRKTYTIKYNNSGLRGHFS